MTDLANFLMGWGTLAAHVALVLYVLLVLAGREQIVVRAVGRFGYLAALAISFAGVVGSLYYSEVAGWNPCPLCWYQRIALYPIAVVLAIASFRRQLGLVAPYVKALALVGLAVGLYQLYLQFGPPAESMLMNGCLIDGGVSCSETYHVAFGYISMATAAATSFLLVIVGLRLGRLAEANEQRAA